MFFETVKSKEALKWGDRLHKSKVERHLETWCLDIWELQELQLQVLITLLFISIRFYFSRLRKQRQVILFDNLLFAFFRATFVVNLYLIYIHMNILVRNRQWCFQTLHQITPKRLKLFLHTAINRADFVSWWMRFNGSPTKAHRHFLTNAFCYLRTYITCTKIRTTARSLPSNPRIL